MNLLIDTIPILNKTKKDMFLFFRGAGVVESIMSSPYNEWTKNKDSINKYEIARQVLTELNVKGEVCLRERREVLKRVIEFESFSSCWPADQFKAKGYVAEIQKVVNVKDSFTRMTNERDSEKKARVAQQKTKSENVRKNNEAIAKVKNKLYALFAMVDKHKRGIALEEVLNSLFQTYGILVREAFTLTGDNSEGIVEQIDGVIEVDGHLYFVEMKWWSDPLGTNEISHHLVRVYQRAEGRAIIISASNFTRPAISLCKEALQQKIVILCTLQELVLLLEKQADLNEFIKKKIHSAVVEKQPFTEMQN
jgi:restriction system protein